MFGYTGKYLFVDLSSKKMIIKNLPEDYYKKYIGGSGIATRLLYDYMQVPRSFHESTPFIYYTGPFTGSNLPLSGRHQIVTIAPENNGFGEGDVGGRFGIELKKAGLDGIVITGKSEAQVYLWINDLTPELRAASHLWGKDTFESNSLIKKETNSNAVTSLIGPAGENMVKFANVIHDGMDARAAGRGGIGAVLGFKKLKGIAVKGSFKINIYDPDALKKILLNKGKSIVEKGLSLKYYGTSGGAHNAETLGDLPIKNWRASHFAAEKISGKTLALSEFYRGNYYCGSCIVGCGRTVDLGRGNEGGPEYESVALLGSNLMLDDLKTIAEAHSLCNRYGMDVISVGGVIGYLMELSERGMINEKVGWGDETKVLELIKNIAIRQSIGDELAEGVRNMSKKYPSSESFAMHVKGVELPGHDPRAFVSLELGYATSNRGACHMAGYSFAVERAGLSIPELGYKNPPDRFSDKDREDFVVKLQDLMCVFDSLKLCKFLFGSGGVTVPELTEWYKIVTGIEITVNDLMIIGNRIYSLKRLINNRCGIDSMEDTIPERLIKLKREQNPNDLKPLSLKRYYKLRNWNVKGEVTNVDSLL